VSSTPDNIRKPRATPEPAGTGPPRATGPMLPAVDTPRYEDNILPTGLPFGTPEAALDCAVGLYLGDPSRLTDQTPDQ
jgi:hypothetical protein